MTMEREWKEPVVRARSVMELVLSLLACWICWQAGTDVRL